MKIAFLTIMLAAVMLVPVINEVARTIQATPSSGTDNTQPPMGAANSNSSDTQPTPQGRLDPDRQKIAQDTALEEKKLEIEREKIAVERSKIPWTAVARIVP